MKRNIKFITLIYLVVSLTLLSCNHKTDNTQVEPIKKQSLLSKFNTYPIQKEIKMLDNDKIDFDYKLGKSSEYKEYKIIEVEYLVKNNNDFPVNFICQSCNVLDYYLKFKTPDFEVHPLLLCNATFSIIRSLKKGEELSFKTQVLQLRNFNQKPSIGMDFRVVDRYIEYEKIKENEKLIEKVYQAKTKNSNIIWKK